MAHTINVLLNHCDRDPDLTIEEYETKTQTQTKRNVAIHKKSKMLGHHLWKGKKLIAHRPYGIEKNIV